MQAFEALNKTTQIKALEPTQALSFFDYLSKVLDSIFR